MTSHTPISLLLYLGLSAVVWTSVSGAELPLQTFESQYAGQPPPFPWQSPGLALSITDTQASSGEHALSVPPPSGTLEGEASITTLLGPQSPGFVDLFIKPVARTLTLHPSGHPFAGQPVESSGVLYLDGAQFLFHRSANRYSVLALTEDAGGALQWLRLGGFGGAPVDFEIEDSGGRAKDWLRLTVRRDLVGGTYDVWINQRLVGIDLALNRVPGGAEFRLRHRATESVPDGLLAPMFLDDIKAGANHPLYADTDRDGMPDTWEAAHSVVSPTAPAPTVDVTTPDRWADLDLDQVPKISEYFFGSRPTSQDSDGDGLPDGVEIQHALDPSLRADALLDKDGDGFSNLAEYQGQGNARISEPPTGALTNVVYVKADHIGVQNGQYATPYRSLAAALSSPYLTAGGRIVVRGEGGPLMHLTADGLAPAGNSGLNITRPVTLVGVNSALVHLQESAAFATVSIPGSVSTPVMTCENLSFESSYGDDGGVFRIVGTSGSVVIRNCRFSGCLTSDDGGAIYAHGARLIIEDCWFQMCSSGGEGGALHFEGGTQATFRRTHFEGNESATDGGAVSLRAATSAPIAFESCVFLSNRAGRGGALAAVDGADAQFTQCTVASCVAIQAGGGGGVFGGSSASAFTVGGSIFWNNSAAGTAPAHFTGGVLSATYTTFSGWTSITGPAGTGNNGSDPIFRPGTVMPTSSAMVDSSNPASNTLTDFFNYSRWDAPGGTTGTLADRGALERQPDTDGDGLSDDWENRYSLNANDATDAAADADQDGYSNGEEFTDKTNPRSALSLKAPVVFVNATNGRDWHPGPNAPAGTPSPASQGNSYFPFQSIRRAILACPIGRRIVLQDGTFAGPVNTNLRLTETWTWKPHLSATLLTSNLTLDGKTIRGLNGPRRVTLDGGGNARILDLTLGSGSIGSTVTLQNLSLRRGGADLGGAIRAAGFPGQGQLILQNCELSANRATAAGGAIHVTGTSLTLQKCTLAGNDAPQGGAVALVNLTPLGSSTMSTANISECRFAYNLAFSSGGSFGQGGALSSTGTSFTTYLTRFDWNQAERHGGAVAILSASGYYPPSLGYGTTFEANGAGLRGGALYSENACFMTTSVAFRRNMAGTVAGSGDGGAVFIAHPATTTNTVLGYSSRIALLSSSQFAENSAGRRGGAIAISDASPLVTNGSFTENRADSQAGRGGAVDITWETIQAGKPGFPAFTSAPKFVHATFSRNQAALGSALSCELLTAPWIINGLFGDDVPVADQPLIVGPRQLFGSQFPAGQLTLTAAESDPARRNLFASATFTFDLAHLAAPVRLSTDTSSTTGGVEPSANVSFTRPTADIDNEVRPPAAAGRFTLMRGCDEPRDADTDALPDWFESLAHQFSAADAITTLAHTHPLTASTPTSPSANPTNNADGDAYTLTQELFNGGRPDAVEDESNGRDTDGDYLSDIFERLNEGFDWLNPDKNNDGIKDGWAFRHFGTIDISTVGDEDEDGLNNLLESQHNLNPRSADTDGDGVTDAWEIATGSDPADPDSNDDGENDQWGRLPTDFTGTTAAGLHQPSAEEPWYVETSWTYLHYHPGNFFYPADPNMLAWGLDTVSTHHDFIMEPDRLVNGGSNADVTDWCRFFHNMLGPRTVFKNANEITLSLDFVSNTHSYHANPLFVPLTDGFEQLPASLASLVGQPRDSAWAARWFQEVAAAHSDGFLFRTTGRARQRWLPHNQHHHIQHAIYRMVPTFRLRSTHPDGCPGDVSLSFIRVRGRAAAKYGIFNSSDTPHPTHSLEENDVSYQPVVLTLSRGQKIGKAITLDPFQSTKLSTSHPLIPIGYPIGEYFDLIQFDTLLPFDIIAHQRGTFAAPGPRTPKGFGPYGQQVTLLENADYESGPKQSTVDALQEGALNANRKLIDNDLTKVQIRWPIGLSPELMKVALKPEAVMVHYPESKGKDVDQNAPVISKKGKTRLRFYAKDGQPISYLENLEFFMLSDGADLFTALQTDGLAVMYLDAGDNFGLLDPELKPKVGEQDEKLLAAADNAAQSKGGELIDFSIEYGGSSVSQKILINKGGFWRYVIPETKAPLPKNGVLGSLEFRDGRGRVSTEKIDLGSAIRSFRARSGVTNGKSAGVVGGKGHVPKGWYLLYKRTDINADQRDVSSGSGQRQEIRQGGYVRWMQDDATDVNYRYNEDFFYNGSLRHDRNIGLPTRIMFKWQIHPISPDDAEGRSQLQIHPDGKKNGTLGCIGIQSYADCVSVSSMLGNYSQMNLYVEIEKPAKK